MILRGTLENIIFPKILNKFGIKYLTKFLLKL
jgi:hypothetical protein